MRRPAALLAWLGLLLAPAPGAQADALAERLIGTWHVLVHYRDDHTKRPDQLRWDDRLWVFERERERLKWTEYPIVVFQDESGRFEAIGGNRASRVVGAWEPNPGQLGEIASGLSYNTRGMKSKTLRNTRGIWQSASQPTAASASIISYTESWQIAGSAQLPEFRREDTLGGERTETLDGITLYATTAADPSGDVFQGTYERDGTRHGVFTMRRAGAASVTKGSGKTQEQRLREHFFGAEGAALMEPGAARKEVERMIREGEELPPEVRQALREEIRASVEQNLRANGRDPRALGPQIESVTRQLEKLVLEGKSQSEIDQIIREGRIAP
jgi:hypothetical protein